MRVSENGQILIAEEKKKNGLATGYWAIQTRLGLMFRLHKFGLNLTELAPN
jgi:hypothetical protein